MTIVVTGGPASRLEFEVNTNGEEAANTVLGAEWVSRARWVGHELLIDSVVHHSGRHMHFCDYWSISEDRQRLIMEHRGDDLEGQITVFDRLTDAD